MPDITDYLKAFGRVGAITDDTQMTLCTAEGLLATEAQATMRDINLHHQVDAAALQYWLITQSGRSVLLGEPTLHNHRGAWQRAAE